jgi:hypothetical protein
MAGDIGAAGALVEGALLARAAEPSAGESGHGPAGALCLNCGTRLIGAHCHRCGQSGHVHRTVGAIGHELLHGVFHFEGKIWRTLPMLALRPGELTRRYVSGERARFVSPMAIFLFSIFLMFAVVAQLPGWHMGDANWLSRSGMVGIRSTLSKERIAAGERVAELEGELKDDRADDPPDQDEIAGDERRLASARSDYRDLVAAEQRLGTGEDQETRAGEGWFDRKWRHAKENPDLLLYKLKSSAYKFSWALIPISLPFIWLLFPFRRGVGMYDHAVFATYSLSFMSLLVVTLAVLSALGLPTGWLVLAGLVIPPVHIYKQLKGGYRLSRLGALWRTWLMTWFAGITSTLFVLLLIYLGMGD